MQTNVIRTPSPAKDILWAAAMGGDVFTPIETLVERCHKERPRTTEASICAKIELLLRENYIVADGKHLYRKDDYRYEVTAAKKLAERFTHPCPQPPVDKLEAALDAVEAYIAVPLSEEQREAIRTCMTNPITVVTGGAGSGKTTMIHGLWAANAILYPKLYTLLCAPTGKASRNLKEKTAHSAHTVHRALGKTPNSDFLDGRDRKEIWKVTDMVIVDEASMLTIELLAGLLAQAGQDCRIVLVGDPNQLLSVGSGNVLGDLLELGATHVHLKENHRQNDAGGALLRNVMAFNSPDSVTLEFDESFQLIQAYSEDKAKKLITDLHTPEAQVLSPFRTGSPVSAAGLCHALQPILNPPDINKAELVWKRRIFREGDRVILTKNTGSACNGDMGTLHIAGLSPCQEVEVDFGHSHLSRRPGEAFDLLELAYATTIHKAQGSEYDTVVVPVMRCFNVMLTRNLIYTAISRARHKLVLVGDEEALNKALNTPPPRRNSALVRRVRALMKKEAA